MKDQSVPFDLPNPTEVAVPLFVAAILIELIYGWRSRNIRYEGRDTLASLIMGLGSTVSGLLLAGFFITVSYHLWENYRLFDLGYGWEVFVISFLFEDFRMYWVHRFQHRMRWMWAAHVIHHSSQHYNLSTALRQSWTGDLTPSFLFSIPLFFIGFDPAIVFFSAGLNLVYQFWVHTEAVDKLPRWIEFVMNTPSHHRVHHASNAQYLDANYGGVFIIWDRLFGTFVAEDKAVPCRYGLVSDLGTFNVLRIAFHEWVSIGQDWIKAKSWSERLKYLLFPPGWTPDKSRMTSDMIKEEYALNNRPITEHPPAE